MRGFVQRADAQPVQSVRQAGLVDDVDHALLRMRAQGAGGGAVNVHGLDGGGVLAEPGSVASFAQVAGGECEHG